MISQYVPLRVLYLSVFLAQDDFSSWLSTTSYDRLVRSSCTHSLVSAGPGRAWRPGENNGRAGIQIWQDTEPDVWWTGIVTMSLHPYVPSYRCSVQFLQLMFQTVFTFQKVRLCYL